MELKINKAEPKDVPSIVGILNAAISYKKAHNDESWGDEPFTDQEIEDMLTTGQIYTILSGEEVIGSVLLMYSDERKWGNQLDKAGYIQKLAIKDNYHGQKVGEQLMEWAANEVKRTGGVCLRLDCDASNTQLCAYYENHGFVRVGTKDSEDDKGHASALYQRDL